MCQFPGSVFPSLNDLTFGQETEEHVFKTVWRYIKREVESNIITIFYI